MVFAAGLLADAVENMQQLGWLPFLGHTLWNTSGFLSEDSSLGDVFHSLLGTPTSPPYSRSSSGSPYVAISVTLFIRLGRRPSPARGPELEGSCRAVPARPGPDRSAERRRRVTQVPERTPRCPSPPSWRPTPVPDPPAPPRCTPEAH